MRKLPTFTAIGLCGLSVLIGCSAGGSRPLFSLDGGTRVDGFLGFPDGSITRGDGGSASSDLKGVGLLGCKGYSQCMAQELGAGGSLSSAQGTCDPQSKPDSFSKWATVVGCGQTHCLDTNKCVDNGGQLTNPNGSDPVAGTSCGDCLNNALATIFWDTCPQPSSVDCDPAACQVVQNDCLTDLP